MKQRRCILLGKKLIKAKVEEEQQKITIASMSIVCGLILIGHISLVIIPLGILGLFQKISQLTPLLKQIEKS